MNLSSIQLVWAVVGGAVLLIMELYAPFEGWIRIPSAPLRAALAQLGK